MAGVDETNALVDAGRFRVKHRSAHQKEHVLDALRLQAPRKNVIAGQLCHLRSPPLRSRHRCRAVTLLIGLDHVRSRGAEKRSAFHHSLLCAILRRCRSITATEFSEPPAFLPQTCLTAGLTCSLAFRVSVRSRRPPRAS